MTAFSRSCLCLLVALVAGALAIPTAHAGEVMSLAGTWQFAGPTAAAPADQPPPTFTETIPLPGTTETANKGPENQAQESGRLTRVHPWHGPAWYARDITIPPTWAGKRISLFLERTKHTTVFVDGQSIGQSDNLTVPQIYESIAALTPGAHRLVLCVNNAQHPPLANVHQISADTQTNWNGILGLIELCATDPVSLQDVQVYPDAKARKIHVKVLVSNTTGQPQTGTLTLEAQSTNPALVHRAAPAPIPFQAAAAPATVEADILFGDDAHLWDEFAPNLYRLTINLKAGRYADQSTVIFGLRDFTTQGTQFLINGRTTFLRGKHDGCLFPLTGHPPMDVDGWLRYLRICQSYGINHIRCHTWCPPEAAFAAADQLGIYIQPELPMWGSYGNPKLDPFIIAEGERMLRTYGNHPSFVMLSLGNELGGSQKIMGDIISHFRQLDPRHLYAQGSNNLFWAPALAAGDDYWTTMRTRNAQGTHVARGSMATVDGVGHIQNAPPGTQTDYSAVIAGIPVPVIGHEVGQFTVYPNYQEISKYTGITRAYNLERFRKKLADQGMLDQAADFQRASGALAALCYREDVEAAIRTPGFGGFQLLDLQDYSGQGTALVGILDAFMDSKGLITPAAWREFCAPTVALLRFERYVWTDDQTCTAQALVANYGPAPLSAVAAAWSLLDAAGHPIATGALPPIDIPTGKLTALGEIHIPLAAVKAPQQLTLALQLQGTQIVTHYPLWVYPARIPPAPPTVTILHQLDAAAQKVLADGGCVLLLPEASTATRCVGGGFATDFWCWPMFHNRPGTMGLLCQEKHPALAAFPTAFHSNWQWFNIALAAHPRILEDTPAAVAHPIVQVIDNLDRVHKLGLIYELAVGPGKLLVCECNLEKLPTQPEARQLLSSLTQYAASAEFHPALELPFDQVKALFPVNIAAGKPATASSVQDAFTPDKANDGDEGTRWCAADASTGQWWQVDLGRPCHLSDCQILWENDGRVYRYIVEGSPDTQTWSTLSDQSQSKNKHRTHDLKLTASAPVRYIRIRVTGLEHNVWASIAEVQIFEE